MRSKSAAGRPLAVGVGAVATVALFWARWSFIDSASILDSASIGFLAALGLAGPPILWLQVLLACAVQILACSVVLLVVARLFKLQGRGLLYAAVLTAVAIQALGLAKAHFG